MARMNVIENQSMIELRLGIDYLGNPVIADEAAFAAATEMAPVAVQGAARLALNTPALRMVLGVTLVMNVFAFCYAAILPAFGAVAFAASGAAIGLLAAAVITALTPGAASASLTSTPFRMACA